MLCEISGLTVLQQGDCYSFFNNGLTVKTIYTYRKARVFAEGIAMGRKLC